MKKKIIISALLSCVILGIAACSNTTKSTEKIIPEKEPVDTTTEVTTDETTVSTNPNAEIDDSGIIKVANPIAVDMTGMTAEDIVLNIWKTADISIGDTKDSYFMRLVVEDKDITTESDSSIYWQFYPIGSKCFIDTIDVTVETDNNFKVVSIDDDTYVALRIYIENTELRNDTFEAIAAKYKAEGYTVTPITADDGSLSKSLEISGKGKEFTINCSGQNITMKIPVLLTKITEHGTIIATDVAAAVYNENGEPLETLTNILVEDGTKTNKHYEHPVKKG